jgi:hypothetical protein
MRNKYHRVLQEKFGEPIGNYAGEAPVGVRDEGVDACPGCGMLPIDGSCGCKDSKKSSSDWYKSSPLEKTTCRACGESMSTNTGCGCNRMYEGTEPCEECGMFEVDGNCGCTHVDEVAPKGYEKIVKGLKKSKSVKNPWAVAWSMKKKGIEPKK